MGEENRMIVTDLIRVFVGVGSFVLAILGFWDAARSIHTGSKGLPDIILHIVVSAFFACLFVALATSTYRQQRIQRKSYQRVKTF